MCVTLAEINCARSFEKSPNLRRRRRLGDETPVNVAQRWGRGEASLPDCVAWGRSAFVAGVAGRLCCCASPDCAAGGRRGNPPSPRRRCLPFAMGKSGDVARDRDCRGFLRLSKVYMSTLMPCLFYMICMAAYFDAHLALNVHFPGIASTL